jgi:hypothetical protein
VFKRKDLLDGDLATSGFVGSRYDCAVCAFAYGMKDLIVFTYD